MLMETENDEWNNVLEEDQEEEPTLTRRNNIIEW